MPNRILRDWTDSASVNKLSWEAEVVFARLIMKVDDGGNLYRDTTIVRSLLFPRKGDLKTADIDRWLSELESSGLIRCYPAKGEVFLHIVNFGQRKDRKHIRYPEPPNFDDNQTPRHDNQTPRNDNQTPPITKRNESESETKLKHGLGDSKFVDFEILTEEILKKTDPQWEAMLISDREGAIEYDETGVRGHEAKCIREGSQFRTENHFRKSLYAYLKTIHNRKKQNGNITSKTGTGTRVSGFDVAGWERATD